MLCRVLPVLKVSELKRQPDKRVIPEALRVGQRMGQSQLF